MPKAPRILVLLKRSSYQKWAREEHDPRALELIERGDPTVARMLPSHEDHVETVEEVRRALAELGAEATFNENPRGMVVPHAGQIELVVTVGGDGTLLAVSHQVGADVPILGVNSAPSHSVGFFCAARKGTVKETVAAALDGRLRRVSLTRMRVELNDVCVHRRVLNEALFCHVSPAATTRYILRVTRADGTFEEEEQKSSGMWIGPAAGSTAAQRSAGGKVLPLSSTKLQYVVREPYSPLGKRMKLVLGLVEDGGHITLRSRMRTGKIFVDGELTTYDVGLGDVIRLRRSEEPLTVLGLTRNGERVK
jgi:NAD+ kinase